MTNCIQFFKDIPYDVIIFFEHVVQFFKDFQAGVMSFFDYVAQNSEKLLGLLGEHIMLSVFAILVAILIGVPLGILVSRYKKSNKPIIGAANVIQAIPSMALLGFMIPLFGIGAKPAIIMVMLYALLPIVKNTATGLDNIDKEILDVAKGIGMTKLQILFRIQFPLALPVIMAGVRISAVTSVGLMTLASYIGAGGLGIMIYSGVQMVNTNMILAGAIPSCILALLMDFIFSKIEKIVTPISMRSNKTLPEKKEDLDKLRKHRKRSFIAIGLAIVVCIGAVGVQALPESEDTIVVSSNDYAEALFLGHVACELLEAHTDLKVVRNLGMGGTLILFEAINSGEIDIQIEYTASMYASVLSQPVENVTSDHIFNTTQQMYKDEYNLAVLDHWGFNNTFAVAVQKDMAEQFNLKTISDFAKISQNYRFTPSFQFTTRNDGMIGLKKAYDMDFKEVIPMDGGLKYTAIDNEETDCIIVYTTDSKVDRFDLVVLEDDKEFFLAYHTVPIIRQEVLDKYPEIADALNRMAGELTDKQMSLINYEIEMNGRTPEELAKEFLLENGYI